MQKSLQFLFLVAFLFVTMRSQASVAPANLSQKSADELWPSVDSYVRQDPRFTQREMLSMNLAQLQKYFEIITEILPKNAIQTDVLSGEDHLAENLIAAGFHLRELRQISSLRHEFKRPVFDFLIDCSINKEVNSTMATVCLGHALHLSKDVSIEVPLHLYPEKMVRIAQLTL